MHYAAVNASFCQSVCPSHIVIRVFTANLPHRSGFLGQVPFCIPTALLLCGAPKPRGKISHMQPLNGHVGNCELFVAALQCGL